MSDHSGSARTNLHLASRLTNLDALSAGRLSAAQQCQIRGDAAANQSHRKATPGMSSAEVAHEINNLLTVVLGGLALLRSEQLSGHGQELLRRAEWGAQQAGRLMRQELSVVRREVPRQPVDVNDVVGGFDSIMALAAGESTEMEVILSGEPVMACLNPGQLQLALLNLVRNAADALTGHRGRICVETRCYTTQGVGTGATVEVLVADTGPGMPAAVAQHATDPFFSTKAPDRGTGLGLWLVHRFVESCGGRLVIETAVGRGTSVRLLFPQAG